MKITKYKWPAKPWKGFGSSPWGYNVDTEDKDLLIPIEDHLDALEYAKILVDNKCSLREVAAWLSEATGTSLTYEGMKYRIRKDAAEHLKNVESGTANLPLAGVMPEPMSGTKGLTRGLTTEDKIKMGKTVEERKMIEMQEKRKRANQNATRYKNKVKELEYKRDRLAGLPEDATPVEIEEEVQAIRESMNEEVVFRPNPGPQTAFLAASEDEVFYGGARGGGKTYSLIVDPLRHCTNGNHRALFIRRTMPELRDIIFKTKMLYPKAFKGAKWKDQDKTWYFPSGARIEFGFAENMQDALRYQGQSYSWVGFDELPQFPDSSIYDFIKTSARSTDPTLPVHIRATGNPGNIGSAWVKRDFIDPAPANTTFYNEVSYFDEIKRKNITTRMSRRYIPAKVWDNPYLAEQGNYVAQLASMPTHLRKQFLEGDWDTVADGAFPEFNRAVHVVEPFKVPYSWMKFRSADWGFNTPFCCLWMASDYDDNIYVYREYYGKGILADEWGRNIVDMELGETIHYGKLDGSTDQSRGDSGPSIYETINREVKLRGGVPFSFADRSPGSRAAGKQEVHKRLALRENGRVDVDGNPIKQPSLFIFNTCTDLIRTLPMLPVDPLDPEKVAKKNTEDHAYDALHYGLRSRPMNPSKVHDMQDFRRENQPKIADERFGY